jgi:hypothetical protein
MATFYKDLYDVEVDVDLEDFDTEDLIAELETRGYHPEGKFDDAMNRALYRNEDLRPIVEAYLRSKGFIV